MSQVYSFIPCTCMSELFILLVSVSRSWCCVSCSWCICNQTFSIYSKYIHKTLSYTQRDFSYIPYHKTLYIRKPIHPGYLCIPDQTRQQQTTPNHITKRPVFSFRFLHSSPPWPLTTLTTLTILSTPTKLPISTDQKNYEEDKCRIRIVYLHCFLPLLSQSPAWLPTSSTLCRGFETGHSLNAEDFGKKRRYKFRQKVVFWCL